MIYLVLGKEIYDTEWNRSTPITAAQPEMAVKEAGMEGYSMIEVYPLAGDENGNPEVWEEDALNL